MEDAKVHCVLSLVTTVGSPQDAQRLARTILEQRLAACVQIDQGVVSHYVWQGRQCEEPELRLTIKTLPDRVAALQALFDAHHPYELPQFLTTVTEASSAYAGWVRDAVSAPAG
jgi:periplasmic divalent cation tolerance protein